MGVCLMKKHIARILLTVLLLSTISCENTNEQNVIIGNDESTDSQSVEKDIKPNIPNDLTLNGETITILYREQMKDEFYAEEQNGDIVNDAVYDRNAAVQATLDCKPEYRL